MSRLRPNSIYITRLLRSAPNPHSSIEKEKKGLFFCHAFLLLGWAASVENLFYSEATVSAVTSRNRRRRSRERLLQRDTSSRLEP